MLALIIALPFLAVLLKGIQYVAYHYQAMESLSNKEGSITKDLIHDVAHNPSQDEVGVKVKEINGKSWYFLYKQAWAKNVFGMDPSETYVCSKLAVYRLILGETLGKVLNYCWNWFPLKDLNVFQIPFDGVNPKTYSDLLEKDVKNFLDLRLKKGTGKLKLDTFTLDFACYVTFTSIYKCNVDNVKEETMAELLLEMQRFRAAHAIKNDVFVVDTDLKKRETVRQNMFSALTKVFKEANYDYQDVLTRMPWYLRIPCKLSQSLFYRLAAYNFYAPFINISMNTFWVLKELLYHPSYVKDIVEQGKDIEANGTEFYSQASLLANCVLEGMRLHPEGKFVCRYLMKDTELVGECPFKASLNNAPKITIPRDSVVVFSTYHGQTDDSFFDRANEFYPERFESTNATKTLNNVKSYPFGSGKNWCKASRYGFLVLRMFVYEFLKAYDVRVQNKIDVKLIDESFFSVPENGDNLIVDYAVRS